MAEGTSANRYGGLVLRIPDPLFDAIRRHAEEAFPNECCGVMLGTIGEGSKLVSAIHSIENRFDSPERYHRFLITPDDYRRAEAAARKQKVDILGFYHSHPNASSIASRYDLDHAFPWFSYLIVSVFDRIYRDHHSWIMENDRSKFSEEGVILEHSLTPSN